MRPMMSLGVASRFGPPQWWSNSNSSRLRGYRRHNRLCCGLSDFERRGGQDTAHDHARVHVPRLRLKPELDSDPVLAGLAEQVVKFAESLDGKWAGRFQEHLEDARPVAPNERISAIYSSYDLSSFAWFLRGDGPKGIRRCVPENPAATNPATTTSVSISYWCGTNGSCSIICPRNLAGEPIIDPSCRVIPLHERGAVSRASVRALHPTGRDRDRFRLRWPLGVGQYASLHRIRRCARCWSSVRDAAPCR